MFATHYHELTDMEDEHIRNYCVAVKERGSKVVFLRRIIAGSADKSYGIHVARLAGLPRSVTQRAQIILDGLETQHAREEKLAAGDKGDMKPGSTESSAKEPMGSLFSSSLSDEILALDVMTMTPLEAMNELYRLQKQAKGEAGKA
jgi:DNA mismatch repair protein MutS